MTTTENILSVAMLGGAFWALLFLLPKARRVHDRFGVICAVVTALVGLIGWLLLGVGTHS